MTQDSSTPTPSQPISTRSTSAIQHSGASAVSHQSINSNVEEISRILRTYHTDWTSFDNVMRQNQTISQEGSLPVHSSSPTGRLEEPGVNLTQPLDHNGTFHSVAPNYKRPELSRTDTERVISSQASKGLKWEATEIIDGAVLMTPLGLLPEGELSNVSVEPFRLLTPSQAEDKPSLLNSQEAPQSQDPCVITQAQEQRPFPPPVCAAPTSVFDPFDTCLLRPDVYNNIEKLKCVSEPHGSLSD